MLPCFFGRMVTTLHQEPFPQRVRRDHDNRRTETNSSMRRRGIRMKVHTRQVRSYQIVQEEVANGSYVRIDWCRTGRIIIGAAQKISRWLKSESDNWKVEETSEKNEEMLDLIIVFDFFSVLSVLLVGLFQLLPVIFVFLSLVSISPPSKGQEFHCSSHTDNRGDRKPLWSFPRVRSILLPSR